jgi:hypothetical protein
MKPVEKPKWPDPDFGPIPAKRTPTPPSSFLASVACFGASLIGGPVAICLICVALGLGGHEGMSDSWGALGDLALLTAWVAAAISGAEPRRRGGIIALVISGMVLGIGVLCLFIFLSIFILLPAAALGVICGLMALVSCWSRGDRTGRAMALIGITPALPFLVCSLLGR